MKPHRAHELIRANNQLWRLLYYDELIETAEYQLSYLEEADAPFYNCAHAVTGWDGRIAAAIHGFFGARGVAAALYLDPQTPPEVPAQLIREGYRREEAERESWWGMDLTGLAIPEEDRSRPFDVENAAALGAFIALDAEVNQLPPAVAAKLQTNLRTRRAPQIQVGHFLELRNGVPVCCGSVGVVGPFAALAEGATATDHRRQGLYRRLTMARLGWARERGARYAFLTAAAQAASNAAAQAMGFSLTFSRELWRRP